MIKKSSTGRFTCPFCNETFDSAGGLEFHVKDRHARIVEKMHPGEGYV
jgi:hypothetical protein